MSQDKLERQANALRMKVREAGWSFNPRILEGFLIEGNNVSHYKYAMLYCLAGIQEMREDKTSLPTPQDEDSVYIDTIFPGRFDDIFMPQNERTIKQERRRMASQGEPQTFGDYQLVRVDSLNGD